MIKNIVFDMGNVLTEYDSARVCSRVISSEALKKKIDQTVFISPEWVLLDMGVISEEAALKRMLSRLDTEEEKRLAATCFEQWHLYNMNPKPGMGELVRNSKIRDLASMCVRMPLCVSWSAAAKSFRRPGCSTECFFPPK